MRHSTVQVGGASFHVVTAGSGPALLLLHGWPEFWLTWQPVMERLAGRFTLVAPDLRGFGESDKPDGPPGAEQWAADDHADDMLALLAAMGHRRAGIVGHDVGGAVAMAMARKQASACNGLFFFGFAYPGIGARSGTPDRLNEIWYQSFHQMPFAPALVGASAETCRAYIGHFLRHWSHRKEAFDDVMDQWVANFMRPGNLSGGFAYYRAAHAKRIAAMTGAVPPAPPITVPTCVRWAEHDAIFPFAWTDRLGETFSDLDLAMFPGVGHFPHREAPDRAAAEIAAFFTRRPAE